MRARWQDPTFRARMQAVVRPHHDGWTPYHRARGHDGGYSAALQDGAHTGPYHAVETWEYLEACLEPAWDIGWDRVQGAGYTPAQAAPRTGTKEPWFRPAPKPLRPTLTPEQVRAAWPAEQWARYLQRALERDWQRYRQRVMRVQREAVGVSPPPRPTAPAPRVVTVRIDYADGCAYWRCPQCQVLQCVLDVVPLAPVQITGCGGCGMTYAQVA